MKLRQPRAARHVTGGERLVEVALKRAIAGLAALLNRRQGLGRGAGLAKILARPQKIGGEGFQDIADDLRVEVIAVDALAIDAQRDLIGGRLDAGGLRLGLHTLPVGRGAGRLSQRSASRFNQGDSVVDFSRPAPATLSDTVREATRPRSPQCRLHGDLAPDTVACYY